MVSWDIVGLCRWMADGLLESDGQRVVYALLSPDERRVIDESFRLMDEGTRLTGLGYFCEECIKRNWGKASYYRELWETSNSRSLGEIKARMLELFSEPGLQDGI